MSRILKLIPLLGLLCLAAAPASAQRNLPGQQAIQVTGGFVDGFSFRNSAKEYAWYGNLQYVHSNRNQTRWVLGMGYQQKDYTYREQIIPKVQFTGEAGYYVPLLADRGRHVCFSVGFSAMAGYETSNWGDKLLRDGARLRNEDCFIWGGALTAELETYISDRVIFLVNVRERGLFGTGFGNFHTQVGVGFKFVIN